MSLLPAPKRLEPVVDAARMVRLQFEVRYVECALAPKVLENKPVLQMFLGAQFVRDRETGGVVNIPLDEDDRTAKYVGTLVGTLHRDHHEIPPMSAIGMCSYALHRNDFGHKGYVNVGTSYALLQNVLRDVKQKGVYEGRHDLMMHTVVVTGNDPIKKGTIELRVTRVDTGPALTAAVNAFVQSTSASRLTNVASLRGNPQQVADTLNTYIESTVVLEQSMRDTLKNTERMHAFMDISETGSQMIPGAPGSFLPVAAFAMVETPRANEGYFRNAYERIMKRRQLTLGAWHDFDVKEKARTMAQVLCYAVQTFDYIGDAVEMSSRLEKIVSRRHVGNEEFSDIWYSLVGDCEDGGRGIYATYKAFVATPLSDPALQEMQNLARQYVPLMTLSVVHGAKIGDEEGFGAHMYLPLMPRPQFNAGLARTPQGRQFLERTQPATPLLADNAGAESQHDALPFMFCEGTGRIDPLGYKDPLFEARVYIGKNMPSVAGFKKEIPREEGAPSGFYYANLLGITGEFMEQQGVPVGGFVFCQHNAADNSLSRGSLFTDMVNGASNVAILPQPAVPPPVMAMIGEAIALRPPARPLEFDPSKPVAGSPTNAHWDRFVKGVKAFGRQAPAVPPSGPIDIVARPHQFNEAVIQQMLSDTAQLERIYDAAYEVEHVTNDIYHYRVQLWVK